MTSTRPFTFKRPSTKSSSTRLRFPNRPLHVASTKIWQNLPEESNLRDDSTCSESDERKAFDSRCLAGLNSILGSMVWTSVQISSIVFHVEPLAVTAAGIDRGDHESCLATQWRLFLGDLIEGLDTPRGEYVKLTIQNNHQCCTESVQTLTSPRIPSCFWRNRGRILFLHSRARCEP